MTNLILQKFYSWFCTTPKISFSDSVLNNEELFNIELLQKEKISDHIDLVNYLEEKLDGQDYTQNEFVSYNYSDKLSTEVLLLSTNIIHTTLTEHLPFSNIFNLIINELFTGKLDYSLQAFLLSGKSFKFQLIFHYSEDLSVLQNTWIDSTNLEYISNQNPRNNELNQIIRVGQETIENGVIRTSDFPIVSPIFEYIPYINVLSQIDNKYLIRVLPYKNLTNIDKDLLTPYSLIMPKLGSSEKIPLQYLYDPLTSKYLESNLKWPTKVDQYLENVAKIESVSMIIYT